MEQYTEKLASFFTGAQKFFNNEKITAALGLGVVLGVAGSLSEQVSKLIKKQYHTYKSAAYFENMMKMHPQLKQYKAEEIAKYWNSLNHFAPAVAEDPLASGAYLTQSLKKLSGEELGGPPPDTFATLTDIQKKYTEGKSVKKESKSDLIFKTWAGSAMGDADILRDGNVDMLI